MKTIKLGVCHRDEEDYSFDIYRVDDEREIKSYLDRMAWSQTPQGLSDAFYVSFIAGVLSRKEYSDVELVEVIPIKGLGTRPALSLELGGLVSSIAKWMKTNVLLHAKPKTLEEIK